MNFESVFEMIDIGLQGENAQARLHNSSFVKIDPAWFDGTVTWNWDLVVLNTSGTPAIKLLRDATQLTTQTLAANAAVQFITTTFTPGAAGVFKLELPSGSSNTKVLASRIRVKQVDAAKTAVMIPLTTRESATAANYATAGRIDTPTSSNTLTQYTPSRYLVWKKDMTYLAPLAASLPIEFHVVMGQVSAGSVTMTGALFNKDDNVQVASVVTTANPTDVYTTSFEGNAAGFDTGDRFEARFSSSDHTREMSIYKAYMVVKLENVTRAQTFHRIHRYAALTAGTTTPLEGKALVTTSNYSAPTVNYRCVARQSVAGTQSTQLKSTTAATGAGTLTTVSNSSIAVTSTTTPLEGKAIVTTSNYSAPTVNYRCVARQSVAGTQSTQLKSTTAAIGAGTLTTVSNSSIAVTSTTVDQYDNTTSLTYTNGTYSVPEFAVTSGTLEVRSCFLVINSQL